MKSGIYLIRNTIDNKIYIGSAYDVIARIKRHISELNKGKHHNKHLKAAWIQYGPAAFSFEILEVCTKQQILSKEKEYLDQYGSYNLEVGYNILNNAHSFHGLKHSQETKDQMSKSRFKYYEKHPEHKQKLSTLRKQEWASGQRTNEQNKGRVISNQQRLAISKKLTGRKLGKDQIDKGVATRKLNYKPSISNDVISNVREKFKNKGLVRPIAMIKSISEELKLPYSSVKMICYKTGSYKNR